ncbi:MAG: cupredoxin domain-containing protein [Deltaproteobacteria bacterium]|nr:cupredoxin domain-containing protein [Deltaproteobacteria bacterium]
MTDHESMEEMHQTSSHDEAEGEAGEAKGEAEATGGVAATWAKIQTKRNEIEKLITTGKLDDIHEVAEGLPGLGENLVKESGDLDEARLRRVQGAAGQLANLADSLHDAADKGDAQTTEAEFKKLDGLLRVIEAQYPEGALSVTSPGSGAKETGEMESSHGGSGDGHDHARQNRRAKVDVPSNAQRIDVVASDFRFEPQEVVVRAGIPIALTLSNRGKNEHAWVIGARSEVHLHVPPGGQQTEVFTIEHPGEYRIACTVAGHEQLGMVGKIIVQ